jgi:uncharacterized sporulation protein YeaH/YhbH (DUF444 family)
MSFVLIDRRKAGRGKSSPNRQKLIRRIKSFIKSSSPQNVGKFGGVTGGSNNAPKGGGSSPVKIAGAALEEPYFAYSNDGEHTAVIIGNREYDRGDEIEIPSEDGKSSSGGPGDGGEDDFIVNVARSEFLDLYYEDCELPNLVNEKYTEKLDNKFQQAGFSTTGSPAQLSIVRTYKQAISRAAAMMDPFEQERDELQKELDALYISTEKNELKVLNRIKEIVARLAEIEEELIFLDGFDNSDMRFRKKEAKPLKTVDAVLFLLMDISGSMDENKKTIARRWFALLYGFIERRYKGSVELVFIAHTDEPFEMSEDDFFSTRVNGGTTVSPALKMINRIIKERYDPNQTNIYVSHASDGDNWEEDNINVIDEMVQDGNLMSKIQFFSYVEVGKQGSTGWFNIGAGTTPGAAREDSGLWKAYDECRGKVAERKIILSIIESADECYPVFKKVFKKGK